MEDKSDTEEVDEIIKDIDDLADIMMCLIKFKNGKRAVFTKGSPLVLIGLAEVFKADVIENMADDQQRKGCKNVEEV